MDIASLDLFKDNILLFEDKVRVDEADVLAEVIQVTDLQSLVDRLGGFDNGKLGESGGGVSGGQGQRIALSRAIISQRPIILLDEATSALNEDLEANIFKWLTEQEGLSIIAVSHSQSIQRWFTKELRYDLEEKTFKMWDL